VLVAALGVLLVDGVGLSGVIKPEAQSSGLAATSDKAPADPGVSTHHAADPPATTPEPEVKGREASKQETTSPEATSPTREKPASKSHEAASPNTTSCRAVVYIGDSTSEGMVLPSYLSKPGQRLGAQYARVGATEQYFEISGARSIVETLNAQQANGYTLARRFKAQGYQGCWVIALGTNDTADVYAGSTVGLEARIQRMMKVIGGQPVMWVTVRSLLASGPYSEANMELWNRTLIDACKKYPNMRVFDWASLTQDDWFISDGTHYTSEGYRHRARLTANALAHGFPASGEKQGSGCVVR
jgi:lysophospholipase L1-like esterase